MPRTEHRLSVRPLPSPRRSAQALRPTLLALAVAAVLGGLLADAAQARTVTWTGTSPSTSIWSNDLNWGGASPSSGDALVFAGSLRTSNRNNLDNASFKGLSFASGAGAFTLNGNGFTSLGNISNLSSRLQTLTLPLTVGSDQTWAGGLSGLQFGAIHFASTAAAGYTVSGSGTLTVLGGIHNDSQHLQSFASVLSLGASQTWGLGDSGLRVAGLNGPGNLLLEGGGQLVLGSTVAGSTASHAGVITGANTFVIIDNLGGTQTLTGAGSQLGSLLVQRGNLALAGGSLSARGVSVQGPGKLLLNGGALSTDLINLYQGAHLVVDGGALSTTRLHLFGGSAQLSQGSIGADEVIVNDNSLNILGGQLTLRGTGDDSIVVNGSSQTLLSITGAGSALVGAGGMRIGASAGSVQVSQRGSLQLAGRLQVGGDDNVDSGRSGWLALTTAGSVSVGSLAIGTGFGSIGSVTVDGAGSSLTSSGALNLGTEGGSAASLLISNGGLVSTQGTYLGSAGSTITINGGALVTGLLSGSTGTLTLEDGDPALAVAALTLNGAAGTSSFAGSISGAGSLLKSGGSGQVLAGSNGFTGSVLVTGGRLQMGNGTASFYQVSNGGTLQLDYGTLGWSGVQADAGGTVVYNTGSLTGGMLIGEGTHDVSRVTRYVGTSVGNGATLALANNTRLIGVASAGTLGVAAGRTVNWNGGSNAGGRFNVDGTANLVGWTSSGVLQVGAAGVLNVSGSDLVLLGGSRTAVGSKSAPGGRIDLAPGHSIELNGALLVNNGTIAGTTNVHYGSLAKGAGVYGAVNVFEGGVFEAGNSPGTVHTGAVQWNAGGTYLVAMDAASGVAGQNIGLWAIDGTLTITAGADSGQFTIRVATLDQADQAITLTDFDAHHNYSWLIASASGGITGYAPGVFSVDSGGFLNALDGGRFSVAQSGNDLLLNFTSAVPEPASAGLMGAGLLAVWLARRRQKPTA